MLIIAIPLLVAIVGAFIYVLSFPQNARAAELGRIAYFVGLLWLVYRLDAVTLHLLTH